MGSAENLLLEKKLNRIAWVVSAVVLLLVGALRRFPKLDLGVDLSILPPVHAFLNSLAAVFLILALYFIKNGQIARHKNMIYAALGCSALFLLSYVLYHSTNEEVKYGDINGDNVLDVAELAAVGSMRTVYLLVLGTHIVLAGLILPFVLFTFNRAFTHQYDRHKKMARWVFPLWLYVAVTGPVCYWMLKPYY